MYFKGKRFYEYEGFRMENHMIQWITSKAYLEAEYTGEVPLELTWGQFFWKLLLMIPSEMWVLIEYLFQRVGLSFLPWYLKFVAFMTFIGVPFSILCFVTFFINDDDEGESYKQAKIDNSSEEEEDDPKKVMAKLKVLQKKMEENAKKKDEGKNE